MNDKGRTALAAVMTALTMAAAGPAHAQQADSAELARLRRQIEALAAEVEAMKLGGDVAPQADSSQHGFGPAAAKVYGATRGVSVGGYGEFLYQNFAQERENDTPSGARDQLDALRVILYTGYKFSDRWLFNSEIEFEHANTEAGGAVEVEFAYLDYLASPKLGVRAGLLLVPMGFLNELHEPPIFLGTTRPVTENAIMPTTWRDNGAGVFGELGDFSYRAYVIGGFDAVGGGSSRAGGFSATGLRSGRQHGARSLLEDPALVARVDFTPQLLPGVLLGGAGYIGDSGQNFTTTTGAEIEVPTTIWEGHAQYRGHGLDLRALYARTSLENVAELNAARSLAGDRSIGDQLNGMYLQAGYDVLRLLADTEQQLTPYVRHERINTQASVPTGFAAAAANDRTITSIGAMWKPLLNISLKADYQLQRNEAKTGINQFNVQLGYLF